MKVTIIVPSLNEEAGLKEYLPQIKKEWYDQLIVLLGEPQKDNSETWCLENGYQVFHGKGHGLWDDYTRLYKSGMVNGDIVITLSPDGNSVISEIPRLIQKIQQGNDLVIASRYLNGNNSDDDTNLTKYGNRFMTWLVNLGGKFKYTDSLVMYRAYRTDIIPFMELTTSYNWLQKKLMGMSSLYSYEPSMAIRAAKKKLKITEIYAGEPKANRERRQNTFVHGFVILAQILMEKTWKPKN